MQDTYNLTRMNLVMRGINHINIKTRNADTLAEDWPELEEGSYDPLLIEAVVSNPPYSARWDTTGKENDARFSSFGVAPKSKADYAFLLHNLYHLKTNGIMTIVLPHGVLFRGGEEGSIRKALVEKNYIDTIIGLPANIFFGTGIPTIIMVIKKDKTDTDILFVDASKDFIKEGTSNKLRDRDIKKIADTVNGRLEIANYSRRASKKEIVENDYNLNIPRYIDTVEKEEDYDVRALTLGGLPQVELNKLSNYWKKFPNLRADLFTKDEYPKIKTDDLRAFISRHGDVIAFRVSLFATDFIDYSFIESLFKIFVRAVRDKELEKIAQFKEEIHKSFHILSKEDQDIAIEILRDIENRVSSLNEADTLMGLISNEKISAYERKVMDVAKELGVENTDFCQKIMELSNKKLEGLELIHHPDFIYITKDLIKKENRNVKRLFLEKRLGEKIEDHRINHKFRDFIEKLICCG